MGRSPEPLDSPLLATGVGRGNRMVVGQECGPWSPHDPKESHLNFFLAKELFESSLLPCTVRKTLSSRALILSTLQGSRALSCLLLPP